MFGLELLRPREFLLSAHQSILIKIDAPNILTNSCTVSRTDKMRLLATVW